MDANSQVVVGAAILDGDRVLAAQRSGPAALAGKWELPGGKVEPGESGEQALLRECREELGVELMLGRRVGRDWPIGNYGVLRVWLATVASGEPVMRDHTAFRWLTVDELHNVDWLPADLPIVEKLATLMLDLSSPDDEKRLPGGNVGGAIRVGGTVRRPTGFWTPAVHALLAYLDAAGLDAIPRVRGIDAQGREILDYVPGDTAEGHEEWPAWVWSDELVVQMARWMRRFHDAAAGFRADGITKWRVADTLLGDGQIICHHDIAQYNVVVGFDAGGAPRLRCVLDWDAAGPGKPIDDVAMAAWNLLPCWELRDDVDIVRRLRLLADSYGIDARDVLEHVETMQRLRLGAVRTAAAAGDAGMANLVATGYVARDQAALDAFVARLPRLRALLLDAVPEDAVPEDAVPEDAVPGGGAPRES